jgi:tellurite resistance protein TehA-like permease
VRLRRFLPAVVLIVVGLVVLAVAGGSVAGSAVALAVVGAGGVWGVAAAFYEIGASEDRDRRSGRA